MERITKLKAGNLVSLSEGELVDCDVNREDQGYLTKESTEAATSKKAANHAATITGYEDVPSNIESSLLKAVASQLISVAIDATGADFQLQKWCVHGRMRHLPGPWSDISRRDVAAEEGLCGIAMEVSRG
ncbi:hypothetical protein GQ457_14G009310 [Hibiscus cannabinus]